MTLISIGETLMKKAVRKFELKDIIKHRHVSHKNLFELCSQYPSQGVGFRVWRKTWPKDSYYTIQNIEFESPHKGEAHGILTWQGQLKDKRQERIRNGLKRGAWRYAIMDSKATTDNGLVYTAKDMEAFMNQGSLKEAIAKVASGKNKSQEKTEKQE